MESKDARPTNIKVNFQEYISINSKMLRFMGLIINVKDNKRDKRSRIYERLPTAVTNIMCLLDAFFQLQWILDLWKNDKDLVMQITTSGISNIVCICKGFRLAYCREDLQTVFERLAIIWEKCPLYVGTQEKILKGAQNTLIFCKWYTSMMLGLCVCFCLPPLKNFFFQYHTREAMNHTYDYSKRVFLVRYPFEINNSLIYFSVLLEEQCILFCSALYWLCCDTLFAQLTTHTSLLFEILQKDIETIVNREQNANFLNRKIIDFIKRHQELLRICELIEKIFSPVIFTTMLLTSINICVNMIELREMISEAKFADAVLHSFHLINIFFQLLVYCVFAEKLTQQTILIANAAYNNCEWTTNNHKLKVYFQILIMKSQKPFYCTAYGFFRIGHKRITTIVNRAMSFYMMLQTTQ